MGHVRILTDSTSDVPADLAAALDITVVPAYVQMDNRSYKDRVDLSRREFYTRLPKMENVPTTAVPSIQEFTQAYRQLAQETDEIVAIMLSGSLSSMYNVAQIGARDLDGLRVHVVDSEQVTMGLGWLVIAAAEAAAQGRSAAEIIQQTEEMKSRVRIYALLDTLEYLQRSGRVGWARAKMAHLLRIKPLIEVILGKVHNVGRERTRRHAIETLIELTKKLGAVERLAILHTYAPEIEQVSQRLMELGSPNNPLTVVPTTAIGAHVGPRALGVAAVIAN